MQTTKVLLFLFVGFYFCFLMLLFKDLCQALELFQVSGFERGQVLSRKTMSRDHTLDTLDSRGKEKDKYSLRGHQISHVNLVLCIWGEIVPTEKKDSLKF